MHYGFITVRSNSTRLPGKCFLKFGSGSVLEYVISRCKHFNIEPIVCTTNNADDDLIIEICKKIKVKFYRGSSKNKLKRWKDCCDFYKLKYFHTIDCDDLLFCPILVKKSIDILINKNQFDIVYPNKDSSSYGSGQVGYSFTKNAINKICKQIPINQDTEMIEPYIENNKFLKIYQLRNPIKNNIKYRMTLDYFEDYLYFCKLLVKLSTYPSREEIFKCLVKNPDLTNINSKLSKIWRLNQSKIRAGYKID